MTTGYSLSLYPIDFCIPTENVPAAAEAIRQSRNWNEIDNGDDTFLVARCLERLTGGEVNTGEGAVYVAYIHLDESTLGIDVEKSAKRLSLIAPYVRSSNAANPHPFLVLSSSGNLYRWVIQDERVVVEAVEVQYKTLKTL